jgi:YD repeat-containing protein
MKKIILLLIVFFSINSINGQTKKYCFATYKGKYEISLVDNGTYEAYYKLYNSLDVLIKTVQGKWTIRDEGVYGTAYRLTFDFTGANSNLPSMKFTCQYDGSGQLQAIIDNQDRTWNYCR